MKFFDGNFDFYTVHYGSWANDKRIVFRVRNDRKPKDRAAEKGIKGWDRIFLSTAEEIYQWFISHKEFMSK